MNDNYNIPDIDENEEISMDVPVHYEDQPKQSDIQIAPGEYLFRITDMQRKQIEKSEKHPKHVKISFRVELSTADGIAGVIWDNLPMYRKFIWKYAALAKSIMHTPANSVEISIDWSRFIGAEGIVKVENGTPWKDRNGNEHKQLNLKYLPPKDDNGEMGF